MQKWLDPSRRNAPGGVSAAFYSREALVRRAPTFFPCLFIQVLNDRFRETILRGIRRGEGPITSRPARKAEPDVRSFGMMCPTAPDNQAGTLAANSNVSPT